MLIASMAATLAARMYVLLDCVNVHDADRRVVDSLLKQLNVELSLFVAV